jgi:hypothetical protein
MEKRGGRERENAPCTKTMWSLYTFDQMQYWDKILETL